MDFPLIIFLVIAWIIYSNVKAAGKGLSKAAKKGQSARDILAKTHTQIRDAAAKNEFEVSPELRGQWDDMSPTQRGQERLRQKDSLRSGYQTRQQSLQQRLDAASNSVTFGRKGTNVHREFKQGSARKAARHKVERGEGFGLGARHAPQKDQNRHRREDWGQKGGGDIISTKNLLILMGLGTIVLYVLSKVSPSDLGL